jgi:hypothetical protein
VSGHFPIYLDFGVYVLGTRLQILQRSLRELGRTVLDPQMLLFVCGRYDHRRACLLEYASHAQSSQITGIEKQFLQEATDVNMLEMSVATRALLGVARIAEALCLVVPLVSLQAFVTTLAWHVCGRQMPTITPRVLEFMFRSTFRNMATGTGRRFTHPFAEPGSSSQKGTKSSALVHRIRIVVDCLTRLVAWAKSERACFQHRVMFWDGDHLVHKGIGDCNWAHRLLSVTC